MRVSYNSLMPIDNISNDVLFKEIERIILQILPNYGYKTGYYGLSQNYKYFLVEKDNERFLFAIRNGQRIIFVNDANSGFGTFLERFGISYCLNFHREICTQEVENRFNAFC